MLKALLLLLILWLPWSLLAQKTYKTTSAADDAFNDRAYVRVEFFYPTGAYAQPEDNLMCSTLFKDKKDGIFVKDKDNIPKTFEWKNMVVDEVRQVFTTGPNTPLESGAGSKFGASKFKSNVLYYSSVTDKVEPSYDVTDAESLFKAFIDADNIKLLQCCASAKITEDLTNLQYYVGSATYVLPALWPLAPLVSLANVASDLHKSLKAYDDACTPVLYVSQPWAAYSHVASSFQTDELFVKKGQRAGEYFKIDTTCDPATEVPSCVNPRVMYMSVMVSEYKCDKGEHATRSWACWPPGYCAVSRNILEEGQSKYLGEPLGAYKAGDHFVDWYNNWAPCNHCSGGNLCTKVACSVGEYATGTVEADLDTGIVTQAKGVECVPCAAGTWLTGIFSSTAYWRVPTLKQLAGLKPWPFNEETIHLVKGLFPVGECYPCATGLSRIHNADPKSLIDGSHEYYCPGGNSPPRRCPQGTVSDEGHTRCVCQPGFWRNDLNLERVCEECPKSHRCIEGFKHLCEAHHYQDERGASECKPCTTTGEASDPPVLSCPAGKYLRQCVGATPDFHDGLACVPCNKCAFPGINDDLPGLSLCYV